MTGTTLSPRLAANAVTRLIACVIHAIEGQKPSLDWGFSAAPEQHWFQCRATATLLFGERRLGFFTLSKIKEGFPASFRLDPPKVACGSATKPSFARTCPASSRPPVRRSGRHIARRHRARRDGRARRRPTARETPLVARQIDLGCERCQAEAKTAVNRAFGRPQIGDRLAPLMAGVEQSAHHCPKKPPSSVRGRHRRRR